MQVGDLVRETMEGNIGIVVEWASGGWLVNFPKYGMIFHMLPSLLEVVNASR